MVDIVIGKSFRRGADTISIEDIPKEVQLIGIYFGAHWAPPCRLFTPSLVEFYQKVNETKKVMEIIFCSNDGNEAAFERNYETMPFLAVPYTDEQRIQSLKQRYGINGIPTLIVLDA